MFVNDSEILFNALHSQIMAEEKEPTKLWTPKFDARFPNTNQTKNCWQNYVDFQKCRRAKGDDYQPCEYFRKVYRSLCPNEWVRMTLSLSLFVTTCTAFPLRSATGMIRLRQVHLPDSRTRFDQALTIRILS